MRRTAGGNEEVFRGPLASGGAGSVGSWSAAEHLVLEKARFDISGVVHASADEQLPALRSRQEPPDFVLHEVRDNGDGTFHVAYTAYAAGVLSMSIELAGGGPPVLIITGANDTAGEVRIFPQSKQAVAALEGLGFTKIRREHLADRQHEPFTEEVFAFFRDVLKKRR